MRCNAIHFAVVLFLALAARATAQNAVTTVAGGGSTGVKATLSSIGEPTGVAIDKTGNLYIADSMANRVYKVSTAGVLTIVAGNGGNGYTGASGPATSVQLGAPRGVAVDPSGNVFIAVPSPVGEVFEVDAKTGAISIAYPPYGSNTDVDQVFADASGHIFIVQSDWCDVHEFDLATSTDVVVAGTMESCGYSGDGGLATSAKLSQIGGIFVDSSGDLFIADTENNVIREVAAKTGIIKTVAGNGAAGYSGDGGVATGAELSEPAAVWVDGANLFIADQGNHVIRKVTGGKISTVAGNGLAGYSGDGGLATAARLDAPAALVVDGDKNIFIADESNSAIREVAAATGDIKTYAGNGQLSYAGDGGVAKNAQLDGPSGVAVDSFGNLYIADQLNNAIREVVAASGEIKAVAGNGKQGYSGDGGPATAAQLDQPYSAFVDAAGDLFIADTGNHAIREVQAATGTISTVAGTGAPGYSGDGGPAASAQLSGPTGVFVDRAGDIFIADSDNNVIRKISAANGQIETVVGDGTWGYSGDGGLATHAQLKYPTALFVDSGGDIFIADTDNNVIREVAAATAKIETVAGNGTAGYSGDNGLATSAQLYIPSGIYVDGGGNLFLNQPLSYVSDYEGNVIRAVAAKTHLIFTVAGNAYFTGYLDSTAAATAEFDTPLGLAGDRAGNLYVADSVNQRIRKIAGILGTDPTPLAPPPTFSPAAGVYPTAQSVKLEDAASGAVIYYTTNGTHPTSASTKYTAAIKVSGTATIHAVAIASGDSPSPVAQASYTITTTAPAPTFSPLPGNFVTPQTVTLTTDVAGATIHYTTNGTTPNTTSATYTKPIAVSTTTTIKAIAVAAGFSAYAPGSAVYKIQTQVATPVFTPQPRGYLTAQAVKLSDSTTGAAIYYTVDGKTPTVNSAKYSGVAIPVSNTTTIKAIAVATGDVSSAVATGDFAIDNPSLVEQRVLAQQGFGIGLATQTFLSQLSLAESVLLFGQDGLCADANSTLFSLTSSGHLGGIIPWNPISLNSPGYGTIFYDNQCTEPWVEAELSDWTVSLDLYTFSLAGSTSESENFYGLTGSPLGTMKLKETIDVTLTGNTLATTYGQGVFTPASGAPAAQLGLACSVNLVGFLEEGEPSLCSGGMVQDFPDLDLSLGFVLPLSFTPVITPGITWTGSEFVVVSAAGAIFTSSDGSKWTSLSSKTGNNLRSMASSGSQWVAVGSNGTILTSNDGGAEWSPQSSGSGANLASVVWSGSRYVAVGAAGLHGTILTSSNGTTWSTIGGLGSGELILLGLTWSGSQFVAVGTAPAGGAILTSPNGSTWTSNPSAASAALRGVIWSGSQFVAVGDYATILFSTDGKTWTPPSGLIPTEKSLYGVVWSPQKKLFVAVGQAGTILTSPDAKTWTARTSNATFDLKAVAWSGQQFAAIGSANTLVTSPDGVTWTAQTSVPGSGELLRYSSSGSTVVSGPLGGLQMTTPTPQTLAVSGGTAYGTATFAGYAGDLVVFVPTPTGWTATDTAHDQRFQIALGNDTTRILKGSITRISTGATLATFTLDRSGSGTITYSDASGAPVTNWLPAD